MLKQTNSCLKNSVLLQYDQICMIPFGYTVHFHKAMVKDNILGIPQSKISVFLYEVKPANQPILEHRLR